MDKENNANEFAENKTVEIATEEESEAASPKGDLKYTDADMDEIVKRKRAEWEKKKEKEVSEAKKLANMDEKERIEHERNELRRQLEELQEKETLAQMRTEARKMLAQDDINIPDKLLSAIVSSDAEKTKEAVEGFRDMFKQAVQETVKKTLIGDVPKRGGSSELTKAQILQVEDRRERQRLMNENKHLFNGGN